MRTRLVLLAVMLIVLGVSLASSPIDEGEVTSTILASGMWIDVEVPTSASWTGAPVALELSWGAFPGPCPPYAVWCDGTWTPPSYLDVYDCGTLRCDSNRSYPLLGSAVPGRGGHTNVSVTPGEHYEIRAWTAVGSLWDGWVRIRYAIDGPLFGGVLGATLAALGIEAAVIAAVQIQRDRREAARLASRF
jgi:hypothetical protein